MAGYSKIYCVGEDTLDGINPIYYQILVGDGNRQWLEIHYFDTSIIPMGSVKVIIPAGPDHPNALIDACLAFGPQYFTECPTLRQVAKGLEGKERIDFDFDGEPSGWAQLREEAKLIFKGLTIYEAELKKIQGRNPWSADHDSF